MVAEDVLDRLRLGGVAERRRGAVRVDVADPLRLDAGALERRRASSPRRRSPPARAAPCGARRSRRRSRAPRRRSSAPRALRRSRAPRARARTAPSPITKPARVASNGREARGGCSSSAARPRIAHEAGQDQRVDARLGAAREHRVGVAALDHLRRLADRVRAGRAGRDRRVVRARGCRARSRAARSPSRRARSGGSYGETRSGPRSRRMSACSTIPMHAADRRAEDDPDPRRVEPVRARQSRERLACRRRARAATLRSSRRASLGDASPAGSKSFTSAATRTGRPSASKAWIQSIPLSPASAARHVSGAVFPIGVMAPSPVTATRSHGREARAEPPSDRGLRSSRPSHPSARRVPTTEGSRTRTMYSLLRRRDSPEACRPALGAHHHRLSPP